MKPSNRSIYRSEQGVFLVFLGIGIFLLLGILAFAIDLPQKEVVSQEMRLAVDAASLGASQQLDGTLQGVHTAILVADETMAKNRVAGKVIPPDKYSIEIGFYSFSDKEFRRLAGGESYRDPDALPIEHYSQIPIAGIANAIRVTAKTLPASIFARVFGFLDLGFVEGVSVATANRNPKVCAAPFAIPLCSLFLNQDPNRIGQDVSEDFEAERQCKRPLFITNAEFEHERFFQKERLGGIVRAGMYARPAQIESTTPDNLCGTAVGTVGNNCLSLPIFGTFIVPKSRDVFGNGEMYGDDGDGVATPAEFLRLMQELSNPARDLSKTEGKNCLYFEMGESVVPVDYSQMVRPGSGTAPDSIMAQDSVAATYTPEDVDYIFYRFISGVGSQPFSQVFGSPKVGAQVPAKPNFPYLRNTDNERIIGQGGNRVLTPKMGDWEWTNPLCHTEKIRLPGGGSEYLLANDEARARAQTIVVPVIIPERKQIEAQSPPTRYCDADSQVGSDQLVHFYFPNSSTAPQIVGFIEVNVFDFNFRWLKEGEIAFTRATARGDYLDESGNMSDGRIIVDANPLGGVGR